MSIKRFISDGYMGCKDDCTDEIIVNAYYKSIEILSDRSFLVQNGSYQWGVIDDRKKMIIPHEYSEIVPLGKLDTVYFGVKKNGYWGLFSTFNGLVFDCDYDGIGPFGKGLFYVVCNGLSGVVDSNGEIIISCDYDKIRRTCNSKYILASKGEQQYCFDIHGSSIPINSSDCSETIVQNSSNNSIIRVIKNGLSGLVYKIDETHFIDVIPCQYSSICEKKRTEDTCSSRPSIILSNAYPIEENGNDDYILTSVKAGETLLYGFIDWENNVVIPFVFEDAEPFDHHEYTCVKLNGKWGVINRKGNWLTPPKWEFIDINFDNWSYGVEGLMLVCESGSYGVCGVSGEIILPCVYELPGFYAIKPFLALGEKAIDEKLKGAFLFDVKGKVGLFSKRGKVLIEPEYSNIRYAYEGICAVERNQKWGYYDLLNGEIVPCEYSVVEEFISGLGCVHSEFNIRSSYYVESCCFYLEKSSVVDRNGKVRYRADRIIRLNNDLFLVEKGKSRVIINSNGEEIFPIFDWSFGEEKGFAVSITKNRVFIITSSSLHVIAIQGDRAFYLEKTRLGKTGVPLFFKGVANIIIDGKPFIIDMDGNIIEDYRFAPDYLRKYLKEGEKLEALKLYRINGPHHVLYYTYATSKESVISLFCRSRFGFGGRKSICVSDVEEQTKGVRMDSFILIPPY